MADDNVNITMEIRDLQEKLKAVRGAYISYLELKCKGMVKRRLKDLDEYENKLNISEPPEFELDPIDYSDVDVTKLKKDLKKYIHLLEILILKLDCPFSKYIDPI